MIYCPQHARNDNRDENQRKEGYQFGILLLISYTLFNLGFIIHHTLQWSNYAEGFYSSLFHLIFTSFTWVILFLPWSLFIFVLYHWRQWQKFRIHWVLSPAIACFILSITQSLLQPQTAENRFKSFTNTELPKKAQHMQVYFSGGGIADYHDEYYFETEPTEVQRLIETMRLTEGGGYSNAAEIKGSYLYKNNHFPDTNVWKNSTVYARNNEQTGWHYELRVDSTRRKVYITIGCL